MRLPKNYPATYRHSRSGDLLSWRLRSEKESWQDVVPQAQQGITDCEAQCSREHAGDPEAELQCYRKICYNL